jgi:cysteine desulfurase
MEKTTLIKESVEKARKSVSHSLGLSQHEAFFFSCSGSQAIHQVFLSTYLEHIRETGRTHLLTLSEDIVAISRESKILEQLGCTVKVLPVNSHGQVTQEILEEHLRTRTGLVSLSWVDPHTGVIQPILDLGNVCREKEVLFHVDASSAIGKLFFRFQDLPVDFLTFDGALLDAPFGTGGIYVKNRVSWEEDLNPSGFTALAESLENHVQNIDHMCTEIARLRNKLEEELAAHLPGVFPLFPESERASHLSAVAFPGVHAEMLGFTLQKQGISVTPFTLSHAHKHSLVSFSLSYSTTEEEVDYIIEKVIQAVQKLRNYTTCLIEN